MIRSKEDGSFKMNTDYFDYNTGPKMTNSKFSELFDGTARGNRNQTSLNGKWICPAVCRR
ncbi:MAG: hypothetical protein IPG53_23685 [Ignavibacteriales bacterium]|nr:hypothetical protein [Ignavibacteriales bacterium]